jgi:hypothetical protein
MGAGADGKQKPVSQMSKGEKKTHDMRKKLEALRAKNAEGAKKLADTNARVSELHSQLVEQLKAGTGTANDDLKKTVSELGAKIAETKMHTQTIQHALRGEDIAADEHGQDSPAHEAARKRTEYVAKKEAASPNEPAAKGGEKGSDSLSSLQNQSEGKSPSSAFQKPNPDGNQPLDKIDTEKADKVFIHSSLLQDLKTGSNLNNAIRFEHPGQKDKGLHYWKEKIANGERPPILIGGGSNLKIFDGNHRAAAYKELGIENIPAILTDKAAELLRGKKEA